jgi:predicted nucleic acid-binding protein
MPEVYVDSSVLIAAAISSRGAARDLLMLGFRGAVTLSVSDVVFTETERNLALKAPEALPAFQTFRDLLSVRLVRPSPGLVAAAATLVAEKDAVMVAAAVAAGAAFLATYDRKHLLAKREVIAAEYGIITATPDEVVRSLGV